MMKLNSMNTLAGAMIAGSLALGGSAFAEGEKRSHKQLKESASQAQKRTQKQRQVSGTVINLKTVDIRGADTKNTVALVKTTKNNRRLVVDLGPQAQAKGIKKGEKISAQGVVVSLEGEPLLVANRFKDGGNVVDVQRMGQIKQHQQKHQKQKQKQKQKGNR